MGTIFRKIGGRIVPIAIQSFKEPDGRIGITKRLIKATIETKKGRSRIGYLDLKVPLMRQNATVVDVHVHPTFRGKGIASALFDHALKLMGRIGKKTLRAESILHPAQVAVRSKYKSVFIGQRHPGWTPMKLTAERASRLIANRTTGGIHVRATTLIPKIMRKK